MVSCPYKKMEKNTLNVRYDRSPFTTPVFACVPGTLDYGHDQIAFAVSNLRFPVAANSCIIAQPLLHLKGKFQQIK
jgi:hypothetical protein